QAPGLGSGAPSVDSVDAASRVLLRNAALVITMDPSLGSDPLGTLEGADVLLEGGAIKAVGKGLGSEGAWVLAVTGTIVRPGLVAVHNHLWQTLIRGCGADKNVSGWLEECALPIRRLRVPITREEGYAAVRLSTIDLVGTGVTTVVDFSHAYTPE